MNRRIKTLIALSGSNIPAWVAQAEVTHFKANNTTIRQLLHHFPGTEDAHRPM